MADLLRECLLLSCESLLVSLLQEDQVKSVSTPEGGGATFSFLQASELFDIRDWAAAANAGVPWAPDASRSVQVGNIKYIYENPVMIPMEFFTNSGSYNGDAYSINVMFAFEKMTIDYGVFPGDPDPRTEIFEFDSDNGMTLIKVTDFSENVTRFEYGEALDVQSYLGVPAGLRPSFYGDLDRQFPDFYPDVTRQTDALAREKTFAYHPTSRMMKRIIDEEGRKTQYEFWDPQDGWLRKNEEIFESDGATSVRRTEFRYDNPQFPGFITEKKVLGGGNQPTMTTTYAPDNFGRVQSEEVVLNSLEDAVTTYHYDLNGNREIMVNPPANPMLLVSKVLQQPFPVAT